MFPPCTPYGVIALLDYYKIPIEGSNAVVVGRSNIVGKPMALMLLARSATVSICTSKTRDLKQFTSLADILVVATGKPRMITGDMIKQGSTVIDVGMNRLPDGKLAGDVDFEAARQRAAFITPVPGGVGPMTVTMLIANTVQAAERLVSKQARSSADGRRFDKPRPSPQRRKGAEETQREPNEACQEAGGFRFAITQSKYRGGATIHLLITFRPELLAFLCVSFASLRLCG